MNNFSYVQAPYLSFYSRAFYSHVANVRRGTGFGYLFLLIALCVIPLVLQTRSGFFHFVDKEAPKVVTQIPELIIENGIASIEEPQPYYILNPDDQSPLMIIDMTGEFTTLENTNAKALITDKWAMFRKNEFETRTYDFARIDHFVLNQEKISHWADSAKKYLVIVLYPVLLIGLFIWRMIQVCLYAMIGLVFVKILNASCTYVSLVRMSVFALTPVLLIQTLFKLTGLALPSSGFAFFMMAMAYLFFAVYASRSEEKV